MYGLFKRIRNYKRTEIITHLGVQYKYVMHKALLQSWCLLAHFRFRLFTLTYTHTHTNINSICILPHNQTPINQRIKLLFKKI